MNQNSIWCGCLLLTPVLLILLLGPFISGYSYDEIHLNHKNLPPSFEFWFGTDELGRDLFTRVAYGAKISILVGILAAVIDLCLGVAWGSVAGFVGGKTDEILMRCADLLYSLPYLLIVILLTLLFGTRLFSIVLAVTLTGWITMARIVRGQILKLKEMEFAIAAQALGAHPLKILTSHLLPNTLGPITVTLALTIPSAIFSEAYLSFLGLGIQAPMASWGVMANDGLPAMTLYPWRIFFPAFFIVVTLLGCYLIVDGLKARQTNKL